MKNFLRSKFLSSGLSFSIFVYSILLTLLFCSVSCGVLKTNADDSIVGTTGNLARTENVPTENSPNTSAENKTQITAKTVVGTYKFETYKNGKEGNINSLEVENKGGKLHVYFSATFLYQANGAETFHEASGGGSAVLRGNKATAEIIEEGGGEEKPCRVNITFAANQATVKTADDCYFNVSIDGVYKKQAAKTKPRKPASNNSVRAIQFAELRDFINDFDKHRPGERFVIYNVPANKIARNTRADENGNQSYKGLFYLEAPEDDEEGSAGFITSAQLVKSLNANAGIEPKTLSVTAVLVQSDGKFDVYRVAFVTKIEGLDETGETIWTATGAEPAKLKFQH
ncbi:MAG TPA: hypothetical protein VK892_03905 [Pyrinomonadaceae bacterium]|nr:hypothetical protein [Pyrinomonadaceae bacterium]